MCERFDFRAWLEATGLSQADAARALGVSRHYVTMMASDPSSPRHRKTPEHIRERCLQIARERIQRIQTFVDMASVCTR